MFKNLGFKQDPDALSTLTEWSGRVVVDVGCGPGTLARALADLGATVHAVEPDPEQATKNAQAPHSGVSFLQAPAEALPLEDGVADVVVLARSLHHVALRRMDTALEEARRVLKPTGMLIVIEPDIHGQFSQLIRPFHDETVVRAFALEALERAQKHFESTEEIWFTSVGEYDSFDAFRDRMVGMTFSSHSAEKINCAEVHAAFEAGAVGEEYRFTNPMRMRVLRNPTQG